MPARGPSPRPAAPAFDDAALAASGLRAKEAWAAESGRERDRLLALPPASRLAALDDDAIRALLTAEHRAELRASLAPAAAGNHGRERTMAAWTVERRRLALVHALRPAAAAGCAAAAALPFAAAAWRWGWGFGDAAAAFSEPGPALAGVALAFAAAGVLGRMAARAGTPEGLLGLVAAAFAAGVAGLAVAVAAI